MSAHGKQWRGAAILLFAVLASGCDMATMAYFLCAPDPKLPPEIKH